MDTDREPPAPADPEGERRLLRALRAGDEAAFSSLEERYSGPMFRVALSFVRTPSVAEEVVQEAWLGVLEGLDRFEGRSSLKTWIFRILANTAMKRGRKEARSVPASSLSSTEGEAGSSVDAGRFQGFDDPSPGRWASPPRSWDGIPEERLLGRETLDVIRDAIDGLPEGQRRVILLRDVEGWGSKEVCNVLGLTETNQRVLLHRARARVRRTLERYFDERGLSSPPEA